MTIFLLLLQNKDLRCSLELFIIGFSQNPLNAIVLTSTRSLCFLAEITCMTAIYRYVCVCKPPFSWYKVKFVMAYMYFFILWYTFYFCFFRPRSSVESVKHQHQGQIQSQREHYLRHLKLCCHYRMLLSHKFLRLMRQMQVKPQ